MTASDARRQGELPLLRWAGGKRWLVRAMESVRRELSPSEYVEPFAGGAAVFLGCSWDAARISDANRTLIDCYAGILENPSMVRAKLQRLPVRADTFREVVQWSPRSKTGIAARLLYLNRTAFGGIYRVNSRGVFNVPFSGDRDLTPLLRDGRLERIAAKFGSASLHCEDFSLALASSSAGSLIFCDPPYSLAGSETGFRRYTREPFDWTSQLRLQASIEGAAAKDCVVILANSSDESIARLYPNARAVAVERRSNFRSYVGAGVAQRESIYIIARDDSIASVVHKRIADGLFV